MAPPEHEATVPAAMPVLSRGKHRTPARGACFMEYTSLLAGEPFSHQPRCVDEELASVLRGANDKLSDRHRPLLVPLLGRAIGTSVQRPPETPRWTWSADARRLRRAQKAFFEARTAQLRRAVWRRFKDAVGTPSTAPLPAWEWYGRGDEISWLFWDLMSEPTPLSSSERYVERLIARLHLLHECYEQAMDELGIPRALPSGDVPEREPLTVAG